MKCKLPHSYGLSQTGLRSPQNDMLPSTSPFDRLRVVSEQTPARLGEVEPLRDSELVELSG